MCVCACVCVCVCGCVCVCVCSGYPLDTRVGKVLDPYGAVIYGFGHACQNSIKQEIDIKWSDIT